MVGFGLERREAFRVWKRGRGGVTPPRDLEVQSSILEAPEWAAWRAEGRVKDAISRFALGGCVMVSFLPFLVLNFGVWGLWRV